MSFFQPVKEGKITVLGEGLNIRNDCQSGTWKMITEPLTNKPINIIILEATRLMGNFQENSEPIPWTQVWFIGSIKEKNIPKDVLCYTMIKTESLSNFWAAMTIAQVSGYEESYNFVVTARFESRSCKIDGENVGYHALSFEVNDREKDDKGELTKAEQEQIKKIEEFLKTKPDFIDTSVIERFSQTAEQYKITSEVSYEEVKSLMASE